MKNIFLILLFFFSFNVIAQIEDIKDKNGHLLGKIETKSNGIKEVHDKSGHLLGKYDPKTNVTTDKNGHKVGTGNQLTTLLK